MKRAALTFTILLALASQASTRIIPVAGHLAGANGTSWITDVSVTNHGSSAATVELRFYPEDGVARTRSVVVGPRASVLIDDAVNPSTFNGTNPDSWLGQLELVSTAEITASAHIYTAAKNGGTFGSTYPGIDPRVMPDRGWMTGLVVSERFRSNVAFTNPNDSAVRFEITLFTESGSVAAITSVDVPAHATRQVAVKDLVSREQPLYLAWSTTAPAYAIGSVVDNRSGDPTNAQSLASGATSLLFPVAGKTAGDASTFWTTSIALSSTSDVVGAVTFLYTDNAGGSTHTKSVDIARLGTLHTDDLNDFLGAPLGTGSLRIESTVPLVGAARLFNTQADGSTYGSAVLPQERIVASSRVRINGVRRDEQFRLNVGISNSTSNSTSGTVRLFDDNGALIESRAFSVEGGRAAQVSMKQTAGTIRSGAIEVETEKGIAVTVVASNIDNRSGDTLIREAEQENERQRGLDIVLNPRVATANVPITFSLGLDASDLAAASWNFGDGTIKNGLTPSHTYKVPGEYIVSVTATLLSGAVLREIEDVHVIAGTATGSLNFTWTPSSPRAGEVVTFIASGASGGTYKWTFPGGVEKTGSAATFAFANAGTFEVELEHSASNLPEVKRMVTVAAEHTALTFTWSPSSPEIHKPVTFTASGDTYGGTHKWTFPGGITRTGSVVTHSFTNGGGNMVKLEIEGTSVVVPEARRYVEVHGISDPPNEWIDFTFTPSAPDAGEIVTFTAVGNLMGGATTWRFPGDVTRAGNPAKHTFTAAGIYEIELEVNTGNIRRVKKSVTIGSDPPQLSSVDITFSPSAPRAGDVMKFNAVSNIPLPAGAAFKWTMPDGSHPTGPSVKYTVTAAGTYRVEVEIEGVPQTIKDEVTFTVVP